jgi:hypothetical protein
MTKRTERVTAAEDEIAAVQYVILVEALASVLAVCGRTRDAPAFLGAAVLVLAPFAAACLVVTRDDVARTRGVVLVMLSALVFFGYVALALEPAPSATRVASFAFVSLCHLAGCAVILALPTQRVRLRARQSAAVVRGHFRWHPTRTLSKKRARPA